MPITQSPPTHRGWLGAIALVALSLSALEAAPAGVAVVRAAAWSPGDEVREGAGEFEVLLCGARLQRQHQAAGIVTCGGRHGTLSNGAERALRQLGLRGIAVARTAAPGDFAPDPDRLFLDASGLSETEASQVLTRCLERHGMPPAAADPERPTVRELAAIHAHLQPFRAAFALAMAAATTPRVAAN